MPRALGTLLSIALILGLGLPAWWILAQPPEPPTAPPRDLGDVPVRVERVQAAPLAVTVELLGNVEARRRVPLRFDRSGRIGSVGAWTPGGRVSAGAVLATLETDRLDAQIASARASSAEAAAGRDLAQTTLETAATLLATAEESLALALSDERRLAEAIDSGSVSSRDLDQAKRATLAARAAKEEAEAGVATAASNLDLASARIEVTKAALGQLELELEKSRLVAPFDGKLVGRRPSEGSLADPALPLGELVSEDTCLCARVSEIDRGSLAVGQAATVEFPRTLETRGSPATSAEVVSVDAALDPRTRRALVELSLPEGSPIGAFARAEVVVEERADAIVLARRHLRWDGAEAYAFVLVEREGRAIAERRTLTFEREVGEGFLVASGLADGDRLIVEPLDRLTDGVTCRVPDDVR